MKPRTLLLAGFLLALSFAPRPALADPPATAPAALQGDAAHPAAAHWLRSELYFGIGPADSPDEGLREIKWRSFLDKEVTPRFPDGLTVIDAYGQWRRRGALEPGRLLSKVLVILYEDTPENRAAIDAVRSAYKASTHSQSVLLATSPVEVSF